MVQNVAKHSILLSVVMVVDGWENKAKETLFEVGAFLQGRVADYEVILIYNSDANPSYDEIIKDSALPNLQVYQLLSRVEYEAAVWAGVENSLGDFVLVYNPLADSLEPLDEALSLCVCEGNDLVLIANTVSGEQRWIDRLARAIYLLTFKLLSGVDLVQEASHYRLLSKRVVSFLLLHPAPAARYRTLPTLAGFRKVAIKYKAERIPHARKLSQRVRRAMRLIRSNSIAPLRLASFVSLFGAAANVIYSVYVVIISLVKPDIAAGWTTLSLQMSGMFLLLSILAFIVVEYLAEMISANRTPTSYFIVNEATSAVMTRRQKLNVEAEGQFRPSEADEK